MTTTTSPFIHRPAVGAITFRVHPTEHPDAWAKMWEELRAEPWYKSLTGDQQTRVGYVGTDDDYQYHYFQRRGITTGFARIPCNARTTGWTN